MEVGRKECLGTLWRQLSITRGEEDEELWKGRLVQQVPEFDFHHHWTFNRILTPGHQAAIFPIQSCPHLHHHQRCHLWRHHRDDGLTCAGSPSGQPPPHSPSLAAVPVLGSCRKPVHMAENGNSGSPGSWV